MQSRWLKFIALLLLITLKEPAMGENLTVSEETRSEIAALAAAEEAAWNRGSAEEFADRALPDIVFHQHLWHVLSRQSPICHPALSAFFRRLQGQRQSSAGGAHYIGQARRCDRQYFDGSDGRAASPLGRAIH
jgi:hypothetical protein